jgi:hypothetical protein
MPHDDLFQKTEKKMQDSNDFELSKKLKNQENNKSKPKI